MRSMSLLFVPSIERNIADEARISEAMPSGGLMRRNGHRKTGQPPMAWRV